MGLNLNAKSFFQIHPDDLHIASVPYLWKNSQQLDILDWKLDNVQAQATKILNNN
jgi:hypothetical protein